MVQNGGDWVCHSHWYSKRSSTYFVYGTWLHSPCSSPFLIHIPIYDLSLIICLLLSKSLRFLCFGDVDRFREDINIPVTHILSSKSTVFCASCNCCSHSGARHASKCRHWDLTKSSCWLNLAMTLLLLWVKVAKVARMLAAKSTDIEVKGCTVMALLDGGMLRRHRSWLKVGLVDIVIFLKNSLFFLWFSLAS